ncbi:MAG: DUF3011 domain-containing protein, partial [Cyanothece sp. SIO1E1]|nr:DUF3011 domain-containing protein [Cyanothece sp. SIO1E1]
MNTSLKSLITAGVMTLGLVLGVTSEPANARGLVECSSYDRRYNFCRVDTFGRVVLIEQFSRHPCVLGRTWGFDEDGIWVDRGCRATFRVASRRRGRDRFHRRTSRRSRRDSRRFPDNT